MGEERGWGQGGQQPETQATVQPEVMAIPLASLEALSGAPRTAEGPRLKVLFAVSWQRANDHITLSNLGKELYQLPWRQRPKGVGFLA